MDFWQGFGSAHRHFDIVNGFFNRCRAGSIDLERWFAIDRVMTINALINTG
jgi:hypothetical protein